MTIEDNGDDDDDKDNNFDDVRSLIPLVRQQVMHMVAPAAVSVNVVVNSGKGGVGSYRESSRQ